MFKKLLHITSQKLSKMDQTINGSDPKFVSYKENGKDKAIEHIDLNSQHCHNYIGKMRNDGEGTYSDEVIIGLITYFFDNTKKGDKVVIELANKVSELLNGSENLDGHMKYHQQKEHILSLAKQVDKKRLNDLQIVDIQEGNKRLFDLLQYQGVSGLSTESVEMNLSKDFDSLDIAKILYYVAEHDASYKEEIKNLKSETLKTTSGSSDYYGLIEMAIRINALLHGITLQGGVARQKKYDALLLKHINPYIQDFPLLDPFKKFCWEKLGNDTFKGIYFDTAGSGKLVVKQQAKKQIQTSTKNALLLALGLSMGVAGAMLGNQYISTQNKKKATQETIKEIFENTKMVYSGEYAYGEYLGDEKIEQVKRYTQNVYNRFLLRYGSIGKLTQEEFESKIVDCLNNEKVLNILGIENYEEAIKEDRVIDEYLIPQNIGEFKLQGVPTKPYERLEEYESYMINTLQLDANYKTNMDYKYNVLRSRSMNTTKLANREIGVFAPKYDGPYGISTSRHRLVITTNGLKYMAASDPFFSETDKDQENEFDTETAKELIIDYFIQTKPVIQKVLDEYLLRYESWDDMHSMGSDGPNKSITNKDIKNMIVKDFVCKGNIYKIDKKDFVSIKNYIDEFVIENYQKLQKIYNEENVPLLPNRFISSYELALKNTLVDIHQNPDITSENAWLMVSYWQDEKENIVSHIGKYLSSDGKIYVIGKVRIKGKEYIYAENSEKINFDNKSYGYVLGKKVAEDYFKTKSVFLQKQTIAQKGKNTLSK